MSDRITVNRLPANVARSKETAEVVRWCNRMCEAFNILSDKLYKIEKEIKEYGNDE